MKRGNLRLTSVWVVLAAVMVITMRWWPRPPAPPPPLPILESQPLTLPVVIRPLPIPHKAPAERKRSLRALEGETLAVSLTAYCLTTPTRRDNTPREGIVAADPRVFALGRDIDIVLEIDWQGAAQVRQLMKGTISIFILPPSTAILEQRLRNRGQDGEQVIARRMRDAVTEISHHDEFDYLLVNEDFDLALTELKSIIIANRLTQERQKYNLKNLISGLLSSS